MLAPAWTQEYCTVCYKQCPPGMVYCSQTCRHADSSKPDDVSSMPSLAVSEHEASSECSESEDDDVEEMPQLWLTRSQQSEASCLRAHTKTKPRKRENGQFLYESPMLKPVSGAQADQSISSSPYPPPSPLLIPSARTPDLYMSAQSVNTYRHWLTKSAF